MAKDVEKTVINLFLLYVFYIFNLNLLAVEDKNAMYFYPLDVKFCIFRHKCSP